MVMTGESVVDSSQSTSTQTITVPTSLSNVNSYTRCLCSCWIIQTTFWVSLDGVLLALEDISVDLSTLNRIFGGLALTLAYGLPIREHDDPYLAIAEEATRTVSVALVPGAFLVDFMPFLKYIPEWMPGAGFQTTAKKFLEIQGRFRNDPFNAAVGGIVSVDSPDSRPVSLQI